MKRLIVVGAGGFGREVMTWVEDAIDAIAGSIGDAVAIGGFLDDNPAALAGYAVDAPILGRPADFVPTADDLLVNGIGLTGPKLACARALEARGARFVTVVHPTARIGRRCRIGRGCVICPGAVVTCDAVLEEHVALNCLVCVGHDAVIGAGSTVSPNASICGHVRLGEGVFVGCNASVVPGVSVDPHCLIGAGSVVIRSFGPGLTLVGTPAVPLSKRGAGS